MLSKPQILIGTDFSNYSDLALRAGESLRRKTYGEVHVVHVASYPSEWDWVTNSIDVNYYVPETYRLDVVKNLKHKLEDQVKRCEISCTREILFGKPFNALHELTSTRGFDLLILGHRGAGVTHTFPGSLTMKMVASSEIPVLVINSEFEINKVAGLVDAEEPVLTVFPASEELSFLYSADLQFISVWQDILSHLQRSPVTSSRFAYTPVERGVITVSMEKLIRTHMDPNSKAKMNIDITSDKTVADALLQKLEEEKIDLAVLSRHQRGLLEKIFIGSVARRLLELYKGNLFILPPEGHDYKRGNHEKRER